MNITALALSKTRVTLVLTAVLLLSGIQTYFALPQAEDPGFIIRTAIVQTFLPGASPQRMEELVTDKLEEAIQEMPEVDAIRSESKNGLSLVTVDFQESFTDMRPIFDSLRRKVEKAEGDLPAGVIGPIVDDEVGDVFGSVVSLTGDGYSWAELKDVADQVRDELLLLDDVAKVEIYGAQDERVFVEYSNARLTEVGLSPGQISSLLESRNIINSGGEVRTDLEQIVLEPTGSYESVADIASTLISLPATGQLVPLGDLTTVRRGYVEPPTSKARASGVPALVIAVAMVEGGNIVDLGAQIRVEIERLRTQLPIGIDLEIVVFQADAVEKKVNDFVSNLIQAVVIVMLVMLASLGLRTGLVVASLIPSAIVISFLFFPMAGVGLDQMSLAALIIALGLLVDNAIVMSESILVQMQEGKPARQAAIDSASELRGPLLVSSLTTAAAFLPIFLAESSVGEYTAPLFKVVSITLLCSWALSLTVIPLLCVLFLRVKQTSSEESFDGRFYKMYRGLLIFGLRHRWLTIVAVLVLFFGVLQLFAFVPQIFFPENDRPILTCELILPVGTTLAATEEVVIAVEEHLKTLQVDVDPTADIDSLPAGITSWVSYMGLGGPRFYLSYSSKRASPNYAIMVINVTNAAALKPMVEEIRDFTATRFPGLLTKVAALGSGPAVDNPIEVRLSGRDKDVLFGYVEEVKAKLEELDGPREIADDWGARSKKLVVDIDEARARRAGVTHQDVAVSLMSVFSGIEATEYREGTDLIPVTLRSDQARDLDPSRLASLNVFSQSQGQSVPLTQVADVDIAWQAATILRRDLLPTVIIEADLETGVTATEVNNQLIPWLTAVSADWPLGYGWELGGEDEASGEANSSIGAKLPIAGLIIIMLWVFQFYSIRKPTIILLTNPLGLIGVVLGLLIMRSYFGFMPLLGVISLAGIVINNAIVLLDRIQIEIEQNGLTPQRAIVESGQRRLRPIVLTTFTTLGGMIPLYLGGGPMFEPMAVVIIFGLIFATALTLGVVPVLYALFFRVNYRDFRY
ncbi:MAG: efflux RND transporter permease subunit [Acidobacteriota bacterium]